MKVRFKVVIACLLTILVAGFAYAGDIHVPGDYPTIQEAIDAAVPGDRVIVAEGTYEENITLKNFVDVLGAGADVTTIRASSGNVVSADNVTDRYMKLDGFTIDGRDSVSTGICCVDNSNFTISNNTITQNNNYGISLYSSSPTISSNTIMQNDIGVYYSGGSAGTITNNTIMQNDYEGIFCSAGPSLTISNNTITENGTGVACHNSSPTISENAIHSNQSGISLSNSSSPVVSKNAIHWNDHEGIWTGDSHPTISDNEITRNGYDGIYLYGNSSPPVISGNEIIRNGFNGILVGWSSSPLIIEYNTITENSSDGIDFSSEVASSTVRWNIITDNWTDGIHISSSSNPDIGTEADPGMNAIYDNSGYEVNNESSDTIMVEMNWWGQAPPGAGQFSGDVDYAPWLTVPPPPITAPPTIDIEAIPNPAIIGNPMRVELDLNNPGPAMNCFIGLYLLMGGTVIPVRSIGPVHIPEYFNITDYPLLPVPVLPPLPFGICFICAMFDLGTGGVLAYDVELLEIESTLSAAEALALQRQAAVYVQQARMADFE